VVARGPDLYPRAVQLDDQLVVSPARLHLDQLDPACGDISDPLDPLVLLLELRLRPWAKPRGEGVPLSIGCGLQTPSVDQHQEVTQRRHGEALVVTSQLSQPRSAAVLARTSVERGCVGLELMVA
jgi:hypothetical protein